MEFEQVWNNIKKYQGERFETITGLNYIYKIEYDRVIVSRTYYPLTKANFKQAFDHKVINCPSDIKEVRGPSYVFAILTDKRICM